jgi:hypothetical protein
VRPTRVSASPTAIRSASGPFTSPRITSGARRRSAGPSPGSATRAGPGTRSACAAGRVER